MKSDREKPADWKEVTPEPLRPAVKHICDEFERAEWRLREQIECGCYLSLHPEFATLPNHKGRQNLVRPDIRPTWHLQFEGMNEAERFDKSVKQYAEILKHNILIPFSSLLKIGQAHESRLTLPCVEWARTVTRGLLYSLRWTVPHLVKRMCDEQERSLTGNFEADCAWVYWRAPRFVHMQPSGNTWYDAATAWQREESGETTELLLRGLTSKMVEPAWFKLDQLAGQAYVIQASIAAVDLSEILSEESAKQPERSVGDHDFETPVRIAEIGKTNPLASAAAPEAPQHSSPPSLQLVATQSEVEQARKRIRYFEVKIAAIETKITAFQQSLTQALVHGTSTFRPRDIDKAISRLHEDKKELELRRDDWRLMLNGALTRLEAEQKRIGGQLAAAGAAIHDNGALGSASQTNRAPKAPAVSGLNYASAMKRAIGFILSLNCDASDLQICRRFDEEGIVELPKTWTTAGKRSFERAYKDPQHRHKIENLFSRVRTDMRKKGLLS